MTMLVLVAFASKYGSTREVAEAIAAEIGRAHEVSVLDASDVRSLDGIDAVVLGSAIYGGHWLESARKLVEDRCKELAARPLWLFSVGPIGDPPKPDEAGPDGISETLYATRARGHQVFAGKLDYAKLRRLERLMVKALHAPEGDFRDWESISAWARGIATGLSEAG
jgi:menaquinone-dependent protoporphyrinogen oxidase